MRAEPPEADWEAQCRAKYNAFLLYLRKWRAKNWKKVYAQRKVRHQYRLANEPGYRERYLARVQKAQKLRRAKYRLRPKQKKPAKPRQFKLNYKLARQIRQLRANSTLTLKQIGLQFGVSQSNVCRIVKGNQWLQP